MSKILYLVRGLPGSGKTTLAETLPVDSVFSADDYFMQGGDYIFDQKDIKEAHYQCQENANTAMGCGLPVAVANTFTEEWEMEPYREMAKYWGYLVFTIVCENYHNGVNIHNVPPSVIERMRERFTVKL